MSNKVDRTKPRIVWTSEDGKMRCVACNDGQAMHLFIEEPRTIRDLMGAVTEHWETTSRFDSKMHPEAIEFMKGLYDKAEPKNEPLAQFETQVKAACSLNNMARWLLDCPEAVLKKLTLGKRYRFTVEEVEE